MDRFDRIRLQHLAFDFATQDMMNVTIKRSELYKQIEDSLDSTLIAYLSDMEEDGYTHNFDLLALLWAEKIGVISYEVKGENIVYISYFGSEGFSKVTHNLLTGKEIRKSQKTTKKEYNYFVG